MVFTVVIADDITGANDIGVMYAKSGLDTVVYSLDKLEEDFVPVHQVTVIDTNSRFCTPEEAYKRVYSITKRIGPRGAVQFIDKQCSVFRGNIGAEFDAMLDALGEKHGMVVLAFPDNGRTTVNGIHYVYGVRLEDSQFRNDPVHPMRQSSLVDILSAQTKRRVALVPAAVLDQGREALLQEIERRKKEASYLIFDARDNADLELLAQVLKDEPVICGSSAPGFYLGRLYAREKGIVPPVGENRSGDEKILSIAGSLTPQTRAQTEYMKKQGYPVLTLDTRRLFEEDTRQAEEERILKEYAKAHDRSRITLIHSLQDEELVRETKEAAARKGLTNTEVSEAVSRQLAELACIIGEKYSIRKYMICGGDTSGAFCDRFHIRGVKVLEEIEPGLPVCRSITEPYYELVLKSGSFGSESFLETAAGYL
ncbi:MAG: four-carbon acid sugar kinase family protein [Lachnospiraceae bacterium]|nr:four-carbon acid sugar kinase family protein [Lachnospiraceae bacterium]